MVPSPSILKILVVLAVKVPVPSTLPLRVINLLLEPPLYASEPADSVKSPFIVTLLVGKVFSPDPSISKLKYVSASISCAPMASYSTVPIELVKVPRSLTAPESCSLPAPEKVISLEASKEPSTSNVPVEINNSSVRNEAFPETFNV